MAQTQVQEAQARDVVEIIATVDSVVLYTDRLEWQKVEAAFADEVLLDYSSLTGGEPQTLTPQETIGQWRSVFPGFAGTQHIMSAHQVEVQEDSATVTAHIYALHYLPNEAGENTYEVVGDYDFELERSGDGWNVTLMRLLLGFELGNAQLMQLATQRVEQGQTR